MSSFRLRWREISGALIGRLRRFLPIKAAQQVCPRRVERVVVVQLQLVDQLKADAWTVQFGNGDSAVERYHG